MFRHIACVVLSSLLMVTIAACGSSTTTSSTTDDTTTTTDTTAPTITSVTDSNATVLTADTAVVTTTTPTSWAIIFSEALTTTTASADNITLACDGQVTTDTAASQTLTFAATTDSDSIADNEFTVTAAAALPQDDTCTLTIGTGVTDAAANVAKANALAAAVAYPFTTPCVDSDTFTNGKTIVSGECWTPGTNTGLTSAVDESAGMLAMTFGATSESPAQSISGFTKTMTNANLTLQATITALTGVADAGGEGEENDSVGIAMLNPPSGLVNCGVGIMGGDNGGLVVFVSAGEGAPVMDATVLSTTAALTTLPLVLKLVKTGTSFVCSYDNGATGTFTDLATQTVTLGDSYKAGIMLGNKSGADPLAATFSDITFE